MTEYKTFDLGVAVDALRKAWDAQDRGETIVWDGPDNLHYSIAATCPPPSVIFSDDYLLNHNADQGRDFMDAFLMIAFQLGYHNGVLRYEKERERAMENAEFYRDMWRQEMQKNRRVDQGEIND